ncbi:MAG: MerR family transcriptional regulator [Candidatus Rokubacteria bacterium]|nr:MerR family transcriptional regulator [Candidatus Rokubacteria bacterium]
MTLGVPVPDKLFFRIGEVAHLTGVPPYVLRYWESEFKLLRPRKNHAGQRVYRKQDIELVLRIKRLLYEERLTLEGAKKRLQQEARARPHQLELPGPDPHTLEVLRGIRAHLEGMRRILRGQGEVPLERRRGAT